MSVKWLIDECGEKYTVFKIADIIRLVELVTALGGYSCDRYPMLKNKKICELNTEVCEILHGGDLDIQEDKDEVLFNIPVYETTINKLITEIPNILCYIEFSYPNNKDSEGKVEFEEIEPQQVYDDFNNLYKLLLKYYEGGK